MPTAAEIALAQAIDTATTVDINAKPVPSKLSSTPADDDLLIKYSKALLDNITVTGVASDTLKLHGATVPVAGGLTTGNVLQVTGASALSYAAVNLAGGATFVTGILPKANQGAQDVGGDLSGSTSSATVTKLQTYAVSSSAPSDGYALVWNAGGSTWQPGSVITSVPWTIPGTIGLVTPNTGKFTTLQATSTTTLATSTGILHSDSGGIISSSLIVNADVHASAAIVYSKLSLSNSILNADINASAAIVASKLDLTSPGMIGSVAPNDGYFNILKANTCLKLPGTNIAATGDIRAANNTSIIKARKADNSGDFNVISTSSLNETQITGFAAIYNIVGSTTTMVQTASAITIVPATTMSAYGAGIAHFASDGLISSSAVNLASSDVTGVLPVSKMADVITTDGYASRPAAGNLGNVFLPTDGYAIYFDNGSTWKAYGRLQPMVSPPLAAAFADQFGITTTDARGVLNMYHASTGGDNVYPIVKALPTNGTIIMFVSMLGFGTGPGTAGIAFRVDNVGNSSSMITFGMLYDSGKASIAVTRWDDESTFNSHTVFQNNGFLSGSGVWMKVVIDSTNRIFYISQDGITWLTVLSEAKTTFITAAYAGPFINPFGMDTTLSIHSYYEN